MTHIKTIIKVVKYIETTNHKTGEITNTISNQYLIANFKESSQFFHDKILKHWKVETMHKYKDCTFQEDKHTAYKNPFVFTIIRSLIINILMLNGVTKVQEQITNNQFDFIGALVLLSKLA